MVRHPINLMKIKISPKLAAKRLELAQVESEIEKLLDTLTGATPVVPHPFVSLSILVREF